MGTSASASDFMTGARRIGSVILTLLVLAACAPGQHVVVPEDGVLHGPPPRANTSINVPASMRDEVRLMPGGIYFFANKRSPLHTVVGQFYPYVIDSVLRARLAKLSDQGILVDYLAWVEPVERANPGRPGNILRSYEHIGGALPPHAARGLACNERAYVAEDRQVPGHSGEPFLMHVLLYTCIDPHDRSPVEVGWSERYPAGKDQLSAGFEDEAHALFESLRFE